MSKILVTGGAGFIGSNLVAHLLSSDHEVTVVDNLLTGHRLNLTPFQGKSNFKFYEIGIETPGFSKAFEGVQFDEIYHLACPTGVPNIQNLGEEMIDACSTGTKQVLQLARASDATLVYTSSSEVYGNPTVFPQNESYTGNVHPQGWRANYEEGKRFSETLVSLFVKKHGVRARTVRLFNMYGPNMHLEDYRVIPRFVTQALSGKQLTIHGDGSQQRTLCFVSDLVDALGRVMKNGEVGGIYNIGGTEEVTIRQFAEMVIAYTASKSELIFLEDVRVQHNDTDRRMPDLKRITELGWVQKIALDEGLEHTIRNFRIRLEATLPIVEPVEALYA